MCGIAGILNYTDTPDQNLVKKMLSQIQHRGPDESGIYSSTKLCFGNVRLSIVDIFHGQQPMQNTSGNYWIVYNGELFNHTELRNELLKKGYTFKTKCDTEVILQLYACYGTNSFSKMNGQFAFAIWDKMHRELILARDRVGIRPLFYHYEKGEFTFGSEIKALFANPNISRQFSHKSLNQIFTFWTSIGANTAFDNIFELPPGNFMVVKKSGIAITKYWELNFNEPNHTFKSVSEAAEAFDELFTDAINMRLRADVEVAAYLSGGIDSSITTAYIKQQKPGLLNTFSVGFNNKEFDETRYQQEVSEYLHTKHQTITCSGNDIARNFPLITWYSETPILRTAPAPMFILSKLVRDNNIKVVVTGEGADEMLAGYNIFKEAQIRQFWSKYPNSKLRPLLLKKLYPYIPHISKASPAMLKMFFGYKLNDLNNPFYSHLIRWNNGSHIKKHLTQEHRHIVNGYDYLSEAEQALPENFNNWDLLSKSQWLETNIFMSGYLLSSQGDRMAMGNSVEGRYPFLDHRIIEFCASLPACYKLNGLTEKYLLKKVIKGKIPDSVINRPKQAYRAPISSSFLNDKAPEYVSEILRKEEFINCGIFNPDSVIPLLTRMRKNETISEIENMLLVAVITTHLLHRQFIKGDSLNPAPLQPKIIIDN